MLYNIIFQQEYVQSIFQTHPIKKNQLILLTVRIIRPQHGEN